MKNFYTKLSALALLITAVSTDIFCAAGVPIPVAAPAVPAPAPVAAPAVPGPIIIPGKSYSLEQNWKNHLRIQAALQGANLASYLLFAKKANQRGYSDKLVIPLMLVPALSIVILTEIYGFNRESNASLIARANAFKQLEITDEGIPYLGNQKVSNADIAEIIALNEELSRRYNSSYTPWNWSKDMKEAYQATQKLCHLLTKWIVYKNFL